MAEAGLQAPPPHPAQQHPAQVVEENIKATIGMKIIAEKEAGVGLAKDHFQGILIIKV